VTPRDSFEDVLDAASGAQAVQDGFHIDACALEGGSASADTRGNDHKTAQRIILISLPPFISRTSFGTCPVEMRPCRFIVAQAKEA